MIMVQSFCKFTSTVEMCEISIKIELSYFKGLFNIYFQILSRFLEFRMWNFGAYS